MYFILDAGNSHHTFLGKVLQDGFLSWCWKRYSQEDLASPFDVSIHQFVPHISPILTSSSGTWVIWFLVWEALKNSHCQWWRSWEGFLVFYWTQVYLGSHLWVLFSETEPLVETQLMWLWLMRIATQYQLMMSMSNPRQCSNASGATWWPKLKLMQVAPLCGQTCNWFKKRQLLTKSTTNTSSVIWWPRWQPVQVAPPGGQNRN